MPKNIAKIYRRSAFLILAIIISGLLNLCLFAFQTRLAQAVESPKLNLAYSDNGDCLTEPTANEPKQIIDYPSAPMPECCLAQNRNFDALVNTANDKSAPLFTGLAILSVNNLDAENNYSHHISLLTYPPPAALALASTVMRE